MRATHHLLQSTHRLAPSFAQRTILMPYFAIGALSYPERGDFIAGLADISSNDSLLRLRSHLQSSHQGKLSQFSRQQQIDH